MNMDIAVKHIDGFSFKGYERILHGTNTLLVDDSLLRDFNMREVDVALAGGRAEDIHSYLRSQNLDKYNYVILFSRGNGISPTVKNGRVSPLMSPNDVNNEVHCTAGHLHELGIRVFVVRIPRRMFRSPP